MTIPTRHWDRLDNGGLTFTELGFGSAPLGNLYRAISDDAAQATLQSAWDGGVRYFDTAPLYGLGLSETRLNRFLRDKPRDEYILSTKIGRLLKPRARAPTLTPRSTSLWQAGITRWNGCGWMVPSRPSARA